MSQGVNAEVEAWRTHHPGAMRRGELCATLGLSEATVKRYIRTGRIPTAALQAPNGWRMWSDEQVKALLASRIERRYSRSAGPLV